MLNVRIDTITAADLDRLVTDRVAEGVALEYKDELPSRTDAARKEFAADICSFANARGGYLIFGAKAERDANGKPTGMAAAMVGLLGSADQEVLRLDNMARDTIDPRIPGLQIRAIPDVGQGFAILVHVPRSWTGPHMVRTGDSRFFSRGSAGKFPMDVAQIRNAFAFGMGSAHRLRAFRDERLGRLIADDTPVLMRTGPKLVLHVFPVAGVESDATTELTRWANLMVPPMGGLGHDKRFNLDGLLSCRGLPGTTERSYAQIFRNGAIESACLIDTHERHGGQAFFPDELERQILGGAGIYLTAMMDYPQEGPIVVFTSLLFVKGLQPDMSRTRSHMPIRAGALPRDIVLLPDVIIEESSKLLNSHRVMSTSALKPACDALWQACGLPGSPTM